MFDVIIIGAGVIGSAVAREMSRYNLKTCVLEKNNDVSDGTKLKEDEVNAKYVTTDKNTGMPALQYTEDELNRITAIGTDVYSYVEAMYAHWVVDGGVEDEWDSYIEQLNAMGLEEMVSLQQGAYAAYLESME